MNSVFEDFFGHSSSDLWGDAAGEFLPRVDVSETGKRGADYCRAAADTWKLLARPRKISPKESRQIIRKVTVTRCPLLVPKIVS
jgi:hypothetical protein